jgi:site-specific recombinase XerD
MKLRNFASRTQKSYVAAMVGLARHYHRFPDQLTQDEIRTYLLHLQERGLSANSQNVAISGLRFFYQQVLGWNEEQLFLPPRKRTWRLPEVLSPQGSRAIAFRRGQAQRSLFIDDRLRGGTACH